MRAINFQNAIETAKQGWEQWAEEAFREIERASRENNPTISSFMASVLDDANAATARATLGVATPQCGILVVNSATQIGFRPKNGDRIQVDGVVYPIPYAGVLGANTGVYVNTVAAQNLAANTNYLVTIFVLAGVLTFDFCTTLTHEFSPTAGNVGVEVKQSDNSRSVVGMIRTNGSSQFVDSVASRFCLSWFNRKLKTTLVVIGGNPSTTSTSVVALGFAPTAINWSDEEVTAWLYGQWGTTGAYAFIAVGVDGSTAVSGIGTYSYGGLGITGFPVTVGGSFVVSEGSHTYGAIGGAVSGSGTATLFNHAITVSTRG